NAASSSILCCGATRNRFVAPPVTTSSPACAIASSVVSTSTRGRSSRRAADVAVIESVRGSDSRPRMLARRSSESTARRSAGTSARAFWSHPTPGTAISGGGPVSIAPKRPLGSRGGSAVSRPRRNRPSMRRPREARVIREILAGRAGPGTGAPLGGGFSDRHAERAQRLVEAGALIRALLAVPDDERSAELVVPGGERLGAGSRDHDRARRHAALVRRGLGTGDVDDRRGG